MELLLFSDRKIGRQDFMHMVARPSINKDIDKSENNMKYSVHGLSILMVIGQCLHFGNTEKFNHYN